MTRQECVKPTIKQMNRVFTCPFCGKECRTKGLNLTGEPIVSHMECLMKATKKVRERLHRKDKE